MKPIIGIAGNVFIMARGPIPGLERVYVNDDYVQAVEKAGAIPIILPPVAGEAAIQAQLELCAGLIMTGGQDIHPKYYKEEAHPGLAYVDPIVDEYQIRVVKSSHCQEEAHLGHMPGTPDTERGLRWHALSGFDRAGHSQAEACAG